jgi:hypothetical protein
MGGEQGTYGCKLDSAIINGKWDKYNDTFTFFITKTKELLPYVEW